MLSVAVCDDEPWMRKEISDMARAYFEKYNVSARLSLFARGGDMLQCGQSFDLVFLDIQMEQPAGLETARLLRERGFHGLLIFITVLRECVFDAFEVEAFDYLVKPLEAARFARALDRALGRLRQSGGDVLTIQRGSGYRMIPFDEIAYCEALNRKVYLHRGNGEVIDYYFKMENLEQSLDDRFFRCHRSFLVHLGYVEGYKNGFALLKNGNTAPVSRLRQQDFSQAILRYLKKKGR